MQAGRWKRWRIPGAVLGVVALLAVIPYPRYVTEECTVLPLSRAQVRAQIDGILASIRVDEGDAVQAGDVIAELDSFDIDAALERARADAQSLAAKVDKMKRGSRPEEVARARAALEARANDVKYAEIEAKRRERLFSQGVVTEEERDRASRDLQLARAARSQAEAELSLMRAGFRAEEVQIAEAELRGAETQVRYLEQKRERLTIRSPIAGRVTTPKLREKQHSRVKPGETVCEVANIEQVSVEIRVPEQETDLLELGQKTVVKVKSLPLHPYRGTVTFIAPAVEKLGEVRFIRTVTVIENEDGQLHEGMTGWAEVDTGRSTLLQLALRKAIRWVRVRFLI